MIKKWGPLSLASDQRFRDLGFGVDRPMLLVKLQCFVNYTCTAARTAPMPFAQYTVQFSHPTPQGMTFVHPNAKRRVL
jgi:hypothetical protein